MATSIPDNIKRLQAIVFVDSAELKNIERTLILRNAAKDIANKGLQKLIDDCVTTIGDYQGYSGNVLHLDVYVLAPHELYTLLSQAREDGRKDAMKWSSAGILSVEDAQ